MTPSKTGKIFFFLTLVLVLFQGLGHHAGASDDALEENTVSLDWSSITVLDLETAQRLAVADNPSIQATEIRLSLIHI